MKDYYKILGVSRNSTTEEIKKSYRRLAFMYHPDRNSDPNAAVLIKDLNEAYDTLGDETKRKNYNLRVDNKNTYYKTTSTTTQVRKAPPKRPYRPKPPKMDFSRWAHIGKFFSGFVLLYCSLLSIDYFFPSKYENVIVNNVEATKYTTRSSRRGSSSSSYVISKIKSDQLNFSLRTPASSIGIGDTINVSITPIFGTVLDCCIISTFGYPTVSECVPLEVANIYSPLFLFVIATIAAALVAQFSRSHEQSLTTSIASCFIFLVVLYFSSMS